MDKVINNDAVEALKERYRTIANMGLQVRQGHKLWGQTGGRSLFHLNFPPSLEKVGQDLAESANVIISLCDYCTYKDKEVERVNADLEHLKSTSKDAEKRLMKRLANAGSE